MLVLVLILANMRILQLNTRSFNQLSQRVLSDYVDQENIQVMCLSEVWNNKPKFKDWAKPEYKSRLNDNHGGVATLARKSVKIVRQHDLENNKEFMFSSIQIGSQVVLLGSIYIPPGFKWDIKALDRKLTEIGDQTPLLITGDFNARSPSWDNTAVRSRQDTVSWRMGDMVEELCNRHNLTIHNDGRHTYRKGSHVSALDLTLSRGISKPVRWKTDDISIISSDHLPVIIEIEETVSQIIVQKVDLKNTDWDQWRTKLDDKLKEWHSNLSQQIQEGSQIDIDEECFAFTKILQDLKEEVMATKTISSHTKPFMTTKLKELQKEVKKRKSAYKRRSDPRNWKLYQDAICEYMDIYIKEKESWWDNLYSELCPNSSNFWRIVNKITKGHEKTTIQPLQSPDGNYVFEDSKIAKMLEDTHIRRTHVPPGDFDDMFRLEVDADVNRILTQERRSTQFLDGAPLNRDITKTEVDLAIQMMKPDSSPGPDKILPCMLQKAKEEVILPLHTLLQCSWSQGHIPKAWKEDNRMYIPKPGKDTYHKTKSYRSLSLSSVIGKLQERIKCNRLLCFVEENHCIDRFQFTYRKGHSLCHALLHMVTSLKEAFDKKEDTVAAFIDFEGAFDGVWRNGVIYRLYESGVDGRMLLYIADYLSGRKTRSLVNSHTTEWIVTEVGLPQGSILSPVLFITYVRTLTSSLPQHIKYADDLSGWVSHVDATQAAASLQNQLEELVSWNRKWRLCINTDKTVVMVFSNKVPTPQVNVTLQGKTLTQVEEQLCVGVKLDTKLNFRSQVDYAASKAQGALAKISKLLCESGGVRTKIGGILYKAFIRPHLEFSYPAWCTTGSIEPLERVHHMALVRLWKCFPVSLL